MTTDLLERAATTNSGAGPTPTPPQPKAAADAPSDSLSQGAEQQGTDEKPEPKDAQPQPKPGEKPAEGEAAKNGGDKPGEKPKPVAPDKYELKHANGKAYANEQLDVVLKKHGLTAEAAQEVFATLAPSLQEQHLAGLQADRDRNVEQWAAETKADPEFAGDKLNESLAFVNRALDEVPGGKVVRTLLSQSGYGNKQEVLKFLRAFGQALTPDTTVVRGNPGGATNLSTDEKLARVYEKKNR